MSGLTGLWNLDGRPVDGAIVGSMAATIAHRGGDHFGMFSRGPVGFACQLRRVTPESVAECQPLSDRLGNVLLFDGRIDNRADLLPALAAVGVTSDLPDSELVFAAWCEWGDAFLAKLQGDFALAVFDPRLQTLVLARDPVGCRPLYYWTNRKSFIFASEIKAIVAHPDVRAKPNEDLLADLFLLDQLPYEDDGETCFDGIRAVLPGYRLRVTPARTESEQFWDFDVGAQIRYHVYTDYSEHLRALMIEAVKRRMRSVYPVAVSTSGGLDSSIVLCIADDLRRGGAVNVPLLPVSYTPVDDPTTQENEFIRLLESERGLHVRRLSMGASGDVEYLQNAAWHSEMPHLDGGWCAETPLLAYASVQSARILMTGLWSDQLFFVTGYLVDLFKKLAWRDVARHLAEYTNWFLDVDPAYFRTRFCHELLLNLMPAALRSRLRPFRTSLARPRKQRFMSPELAVRVKRRRPRISHPRYATAHARNIYQAIRAKSHRLQFEADEKMTCRYGIEAVTPFLDRDVIAYLMSIPGDIQNHNGVPRALLRDAMRGILPEAICRRRWREEGTDSPVIERANQDAYLSTKTRLQSCKDLGLCSDARLVDADSLEFIGLEFWSRMFFSDKLNPSQLSPKGAYEDRTGHDEGQRPEAALFPAQTDHSR
jgi:asparagine synthase (glutamine-hydrolysing)